MFTDKSQPRNILKELVQRTKSQVRALDNMNYRKVKKIFMNDDTSAGDPNSFEQDDDAVSQVCHCAHISCVIVLMVQKMVMLVIIDSAIGRRDCGTVVYGIILVFGGCDGSDCTVSLVVKRDDADGGGRDCGTVLVSSVTLVFGGYDGGN